MGLESFTAGLLALLLALLGLLFLYWTYGCWSLRYLVDRNSLSVRWAGNLLQIPLGSITALIPGETATPPQVLSGVRWPGYFVGRATVPGFEELDEVHLFSTHASYADLLYVVTPIRVYGFSVPDTADFAREIGLRRRMGPTEPVQEGVERWRFWSMAAWQDWKVVLPLGIAVAAGLSLFAYLVWSLADSPDVRVLHLNPLGIADQIGPKEQLLVLPAAGLLALLANMALGFALYQRERFAAHLVMWGSLALQAVLWGGALYLLASR